MHSAKGLSMDSDKKLSSDMIFEILTRVPSLKTLDTCKLVSKEWQELIQESSFMPTYCKRTKNVFGYFVQDIRNNRYVSMFVSLDQSNNNVCCIERMPQDMRILASCNQGIVCCLRYIGQNCRYYVCKPTTREWQVMPNPKTRYQTVATAVMVLQSTPLCLHYKIIRLSPRGIFGSMNAYYKCEIFDSKLWTWQEEHDVILPYEEFIISRNPTVEASNSVHWLTNYDNVVVFDQEKNSFDKFALPAPVLEKEAYRCKQLVEYEGKLGFTCQREQDNNMELWIIEGRRNRNWTKKMVVNIENLERIVKYPSLVGFCNADVAFVKAYYEVLFYKFQDRSYDRVMLDGLMNAMEYFQYRSDLELVNLRGPRICSGTEIDTPSIIKKKRAPAPSLNNQSSPVFGEKL